MTSDDLKKSVNDKAKSFLDSVFTADIYIRRDNVPVFVMTCAIALSGSLLFGMYFAKQEAAALHAKERNEIVQNFANIMEAKDSQIDGLTNVIIASQKDQASKLEAIGETTSQIAALLESNPQFSGQGKERVARLEEQVRQLQAIVERQRLAAPSGEMR